MDAVVAMEGIGPMSGTPKQLGFVAGSLDALALDCVCADIIGYRVADIPILHQALSRGHWITSEEQIQVIGASVNDVRPASFEKVAIIKNISFLTGYVPKFVENLVRDLTVQKPRFNREKCILCGRCVQICPAKALRIEVDEKRNKKHVAINDEKCIRCYCCHEICAPEAIVLKRSLCSQKWTDKTAT
jgi:ferredoxin